MPTEFLDGMPSTTKQELRGFERVSVSAEIHRKSEILHVVYLGEFSVLQPTPPTHQKKKSKLPQIVNSLPIPWSYSFHRRLLQVAVVINFWLLLFLNIFLDWSLVQVSTETFNTKLFLINWGKKKKDFQNILLPFFTAVVDSLF